MGDEGDWGAAGEVEKRPITIREQARDKGSVVVNAVCEWGNSSSVRPGKRALKMRRTLLAPLGISEINYI